MSDTDDLKTLAAQARELAEKAEALAELRETNRALEQLYREQGGKP
jgi:hypothetical protein